MKRGTDPQMAPNKTFDPLPMERICKFTLLTRLRTFDT